MHGLTKLKFGPKSEEKHEVGKNYINVSYIFGTTD
jgi:hypothetical protein